MTSTSIDTKIESGNTKFVTSILNETITRLSLIVQLDKEIEDSPSSATNTDQIQLNKFATDVNNIKRSFYKIIYALERQQSVTDFSGVSAAKKESDFLTEYGLNKTKLKEQCSAILKLEQDLANHSAHIATVDESIIKCAMQNRFIKTWEKARRDQNDHFYRMLIGGLQNAIDEYSYKIVCENRSILEIETYSLAEMEMHKEESTRWSEKFDVDLNRTEIDIQMSTAELEGMKMKYENTVQSIEFRGQEMVDFVALKEERALQKDCNLMKLINNHKEHLLAKCHSFSELI